jgi:nitroreductase
MDVLEAISIRRSVRKYGSEAIDEGHLGQILEAARLAPSAGNRQPWRFVIVEDKNLKEKVSVAANRQTFLKDASVIVVAATDPDASARWHEKDTMIALEHVVLAATSLGYGTCWIGAFDETEVKRLLKIPERIRVVALLPIGVSNEKPEARPRKDFHEIFYKNEWQIPLVLKSHHPQIGK